MLLYLYFSGVFKKKIHFVYKKQINTQTALIVQVPDKWFHQLVALSALSLLSINGSPAYQQPYQ